MSKDDKRFFFLNIILEQNLKNTAYLCREDEEARLLRRAPGERELRELEFEELQDQREAEGGGRKNSHTHTKPTRGYRVHTIDKHEHMKYANMTGKYVHTEIMRLSDTYT